MGLEHLHCEERARDLPLFDLDKKYQIASFQQPQGCYWEGEARLFTVVHGERIRDGSQKLKEEQLTLGVR